MRVVLSLFALLSLLSTVNAAEYKGITYTVEPLVGYASEKKENPFRTKGVFTYGARVIAGWKILSGEIEYTEGKSEELIGSPASAIDEKTQRLRVGLRSTYSLGSLLDWHLRGGGEGQRRKTTTRTTTSSSTVESPSMVYPYLGTGVSIHLGSKLSLNGSVTATLKDLNDLKQTEYATTFGVGLHLL